VMSEGILSPGDEGKDPVTFVLFFSPVKVMEMGDVLFSGRFLRCRYAPKDSNPGRLFIFLAPFRSERLFPLSLLIRRKH